MTESALDLAQHIELACLSPTLTIRDIDRLVEEASLRHFFGVCVPPFWVKRAKREIGSSHIALVTVVGYPLGFNMTETKLDEIKRGIENGADEVDVVMNITSFKTGIPWTKVELAKCARLAHDHQKLITITLETAYLSDEEVSKACKMCSDAGADFVKSSTGYADGWATVEQIHQLRKGLPPDVGIKVTQEFTTIETSRRLIEAGADRLSIVSPTFAHITIQT